MMHTVCFAYVHFKVHDSCIQPNSEINTLLLNQKLDSDLFIRYLLSVFYKEIRWYIKIWK